MSERSYFHAAGLKVIFSPASPNDLIRILNAWRFWVLAAWIGAVLGALVYIFAPPPYRARASANVDFNLELAWPKKTDRQQFYYLERESRKLEEIAWSDAVLQAVADADGYYTVAELRSGKLRLSQPAQGGWHFFADDRDPARASSLASNWVQAFVTYAIEDIDGSASLNKYIQIEATQKANLPLDRSVPFGSYLVIGAAGLCFSSVFIILFFDFTPTDSGPANRKRQAPRRAKRNKK